MKSTLNEILLKYINSTPGWIGKGYLYYIAEQEEYSPETSGRNLRKMAELGMIKVDYYTGKRGQTLVRYARLGEPEVVIKPHIVIELINGNPIAKYAT